MEIAEPQPDTQDRPSGHLLGRLNLGSLTGQLRTALSNDRSFSRTRFRGIDRRYRKAVNRAVNQGQAVELPRLFEEDDLKELFRGDVDAIRDSSPDIAQVSYDNKANRPTILVQKTAQEIQILYDRPLRLSDGSLDPEARVTRLMFSRDRVTLTDAKIALNLMEANGQIVDINKLNITGTEKFRSSMRGALMAVQEDRIDSAKKSMNEWAFMLKEDWKWNYKDLPGANQESSESAEMLRKANRAAQIAGAFNQIDSSTASRVYKMIGPDGRDPKADMYHPPDFEAIWNVMETAIANKSRQQYRDPPAPANTNGPPSRASTYIQSRAAAGAPKM